MLSHAHIGAADILNIDLRRLLMGMGGGRAKAKCLELQTQDVAVGPGTRQRMGVRRDALITIDHRQGQGSGTKSRDDTFAG